MISRYAAADCPINNDRSRKVTLEGMSKMDELAKKHGVNLVDAWSVHSEHLQVLVFEAASFEALQAFSDEPVITNMTNLYTNEVKVAETMQASMQRIMRA